ncbi:phenylpyruvate tautomerase MIF-related protein [Pseudodesulfovibrio sp.]|nr:phenylpyruvate tautomerase MIF-related protein [Pseudodesulfovibrio sp.]
MPFIKVETNVTMDAAKSSDTAKALSALAADMLGKPEAYVLSIFEGGKALIFGGTDDPAAYVTVDSIGLAEDRTAEFSATLCSFLESALGIPGNRVYIAFGDIERHLFGWDSKTF